jgi:hypothetical protein
MGAGQHEQARPRGRRRGGDPVRGPSELLEVGKVVMVQAGGLDLAVLGHATDRSGDLDPAAVHARLDAVQLIERVLAVLLLPEVS